MNKKSRFLAAGTIISALTVWTCTTLLPLAAESFAKGFKQVYKPVRKEH